MKNRHLCVTLICKQSAFEQQQQARVAFREFSQKSTVNSDRLKFTYLYEDVQHSFVKALAGVNQTRSETTLEVVIIWRTDVRKMNYEFMQSGWSLDAKSLPQSRKELEKRLTEVLKGDMLLPYR